MGDENFYTCFFMGGLGNQLFQASHTLSQSWKNKVKSLFIPNSYTPMQGRNTKNYVDNIFRNLSFTNNLNPQIRITEKSWEYINLIYPKNVSIEFYGYYQSSKNFYGFDNEMREIFSAPIDFKEKIISKYPKLKESKTCSLHIRRGDSFKNLSIHPIVDKLYFEKAIKCMGEISHLFVFTDDKLWAKENIKFDNITFIEEDEDYKEIWIMSFCENNIIVNSTFSWWGSFLNKNINKKIIAPSIWFGPKGPSIYKDIYEDYWQIIDVEYINGFLN